MHYIVEHCVQDVLALEKVFGALKAILHAVSATNTGNQSTMVKVT